MKKKLLVTMLAVVMVMMLISMMAVVVSAADGDATIESVSITVDGVTYTEGDVTVYADSRVTINVYGANLGNGTNDNAVSFSSGDNGRLWGENWTADADGTTVACEITSDRFNNSNRHEICFSNNWLTAEDWQNTGIKVTYSDTYANTFEVKYNIIGEKKEEIYFHLNAPDQYVLWGETVSFTLDLGLHYTLKSLDVKDEAGNSILLDGYSFVMHKSNITITVEVECCHRKWNNGVCENCDYECPHFNIDASGICAMCVMTFEASVDGVFYEDIDDAVTAAQNTPGSVLKLIKHGAVLSEAITEGNFTFDFNGYKISVGTNYFALMKSGHLTIIDSVGGGGLLTNGMISAYNGEITIYNGDFDEVVCPVNGTLTIYGGQFNTVGQSPGNINLYGGSYSKIDNYYIKWSYTAENYFYYIYNSGDLVSKDTEELYSVDVKEGADFSHAVVTVDPCAYTGTQVKPNVTVSIQNKVIDPTYYDITYTNNINAGTATVTVAAKADSHYTGNASVSFTIEKADGAITNISDISKSYDGREVTSPTFDKLGDGAVTLEYKTADADDSAYATAAPINAGSYVVRITVAEGTNHKQASVCAEFIIRKATAPEILLPTAGDLIYGQKLSDSALTSIDTNGTFAWENGDTVPSVTNNGFVVVYTPNDTHNFDYTGVTLTKTIPVTVSPKEVTVTAEDITICVGGAYTLTYTVNGLVDGDTLTAEPILSTDATVNTAGEYTITANGADAGNNYSITHENGTLTVGNHAYIGVMTTTPTCVAGGEMTYTCSHDSSHTYTEEVAIDENAHSWNEGVITKQPTCTEKGVKTYTCTHNNAHTKTEDVAIDENAHAWNEGAVTTEPTCTEKGVKTYTCIHDNQHTKTEDVNALGHAYDDACDATCNTCGEERTPSDHVDADENDTCDVCGAEIPKDKLSGGAVAGIVIGSAVGLGGGGFALWWFVFRKKRII